VGLGGCVDELEGGSGEVAEAEVTSRLAGAMLATEDASDGGKNEAGDSAEEDEEVCCSGLDPFFSDMLAMKDFFFSVIMSGDVVG